MAEVWQFWAAALMMAGAVLATLLQALRAPQEPAGARTDQAVYRDQLLEVDRDLARGTIAAPDAALLKTEVSRRLLEADRHGRTQTPAAPIPVGAAVAVIAAALAGAAGLYLHLGAPGLPDLALSTRLALADDIYRSRPGQDAAEAANPQPPAAVDPALQARVDALRASAQTRPDDTELLSGLALAEASLGDLIEARMTQSRLIAVKAGAANANDHAALAWMLIAAAGGYVSPEAEAELIQALERDPKNGLARYYSGLMFAQTGRPDRAFALWAPLLAEGPEAAPWIGQIRAGIEDLAASAGVHYALPAPLAGTGGQPGAEAMAAAAAMSPEDRQAMIAGMVEGLADRLATEGGPAADWARLITALATLNQTDRARAILAEARTTFAQNPADMAEINRAATAAGFGP